MRVKGTAQTITATSPAAASTVVHTSVFKGSLFRKAEFLVIDTLFAGATGGTLDVYLQKKTGSDAWLDILHWPQIAAGATKKYTVSIDGRGTSIVEVGGGTDSSPGVALAANTVVNAIPGDDVRIIFVAGGGTSAGASQTITITPYTEVD